MTVPNIAFIGAGNMASSIILGAINSGHPAENIHTCGPANAKRAALLEQQPGINTHDHSAMVVDVDIIVLSVKPQILKSVCLELAQQLKKRTHAHPPLIISVAAGITLNALQQWLGELPMVRCMPNTPSMVSLGASGLYANEVVSQEQKLAASQLLSSVGIVEWVPVETDLDVVTAISGSAPAYFFLLMESMTQAAVDMGLTEDSAKKLCIQTCLGAASLAQQSDDSLAELRRKVTSPGGTTAKAIERFENDGLRQLVKHAMQDCADRASEIAHELS